jgi:hypothetical protein
VVSRSNRRDPRTYGLNDAGAFVARTKWHRTARTASDEVDVSAAKPAGRVLHQYFVRFGLINVNVHHLVVTGALEKDGCPRFHDVAPFDRLATGTRES